MSTSRRQFVRQTALTATGAWLGVNSISAKSYRRIIGSNDRVLVGIVGYSDRFNSSLLPSFMNHYKELNFDVIAVSDIWKLRREEGVAGLKQKFDHEIQGCINNDELYRNKDIDAVIISTADFQHARHCIEAVKAGKDA